MFSSAAFLSGSALFSMGAEAGLLFVNLAQMQGLDGPIWPILMLIGLLLNLCVLLAIWLRLGERAPAPVEPSTPPPARDEDEARRLAAAQSKQLDQVIELLDMINDNANLNTDYVLEALQGGGPMASSPARETAGRASSAKVAAKPAASATPTTPAASAPQPSVQATAVEADAAPADAAVMPDEPLEQAFFLLETRDQDYRGRLDEAIRLFRGELNTVNAGRAQTGLSEAFFWLGDVATEKRDEKKYHGEGVTHGEKSVRLAPDAIEAHFWYAANMGAHGVANGIMSSLNYLNPLQKHGNISLEMDRDFFFAAPLRLMGRFYHQVPGFLVSGNPTKQADEMLHEAVERGGAFFLNHLYLAEFLRDNRGKKEARQLLEGILDQQPTVYPNYNQNVLAECRKLMRRL